MLRRIALVAIIAGAFCGGMYTTFGCGGTPTEVTPVASLRGTVTNAQSGAPLSGVSVSAAGGGSSLSLLTDSAGHYEFVVPQGNVTVTATKSGFQNFSKTVNVQSGDNNLDIALQPQ